MNFINFVDFITSISYFFIFCSHLQFSTSLLFEPPSLPYSIKIAQTLLNRIKKYPIHYLKLQLVVVLAYFFLSLSPYCLHILLNCIHNLLLLPLAKEVTIDFRILKLARQAKHTFIANFD